MNENRTTELCRLNDEEVAALAKNGDSAAVEHIIARYRNFVYKTAGMYFVSGGDKEDLIQEGMIGLYKAVRDFDKSRNASFSSFASICVRRQIISAVKASTRKKHIPLNTYVSLSDKDDSSELGPSANETSEPLSVVLDKEYRKRISIKINKLLSKFEMRVLFFYLEGMSYAKIADAVGKDIKAVDNAICRIKKKLLFLFQRDED